MEKIIGIYGSAGCGRGIMPLVRQNYSDSKLFFLDDFHEVKNINGHEIISWQEFLEFKRVQTGVYKYVSIAVSDPCAREAIANRVLSSCVDIIEARAPNVIQMDDVTIGAGACLSPHVTMTSNIRIGKFFHANIYSYVEHDCIIGDYVTLGPGAKINGNVKIGDRAYIGSNAVIKQGVVLGSDTVIGMGAVVTKNVESNTTVVGNPARTLLN